MIKIAIVCKIMPIYRVGLFKKLSKSTGNFRFNIFGDIKSQKGIQTISQATVSESDLNQINWTRTKNYFYKPDLLLWQTGISRSIFKGEYKVYVFEGAISHIGVWFQSILCKIFRRKVIFWSHGDRGLDKGFKAFLRLVLFRFIGDGMFLYGKTQKDVMVKKGYDPNKLFVINNSLDFEKQQLEYENFDVELFNEITNKLSFLNKAFTILFMGRLVENKKVHEIVKAVGKLRNSGILINCIIIGEGPEKLKLQDLVSNLNLGEQFRFVGGIYDEKYVHQYFKIADLLVSPGNVGLNCIHSMAYGVPVLTHDNFIFQNPEVEVINDGVNGILYAYNNFSDLVNKLEYWIKNRKKSRELSQICISSIKENYTPTYQANAMIEGVKKIL
ncbi:glycosyltransferase [Maribacter hydrothermalis]|uniref:Glycosyl transferase family 1 domain-containing protein n=1 Tax=Maribacter hydrothermalis TaxID=1836467 RepID=A0A1B7ZCD1_9FLAO|nr:glycosyltransferase [Maribacter hydrothermalis]APQ18035.1 hypothetical protein BTR34_12150 [Maribacter hydrothermalis]OBR40577.1 hypothetical protein A9200_15810 [Maribacter hydrothermalis]